MYLFFMLETNDIFYNVSLLSILYILIYLFPEDGTGTVSFIPRPLTFCAILDKSNCYKIYFALWLLAEVQSYYE